jgi:DNA primase
MTVICIINEIKRVITIEALLRHLGVELRRSRARCPVHGGSNGTSFEVRGQRWRCHSCNARGDVVDLAEALLNVDRAGAIQYLAQLGGIGRRRMTRMRVRRAIRKREQEQEAARMAKWRAHDQWMRALDSYRQADGETHFLMRAWARDPEAKDPLTEHVLDELSAALLRWEVAEVEEWQCRINLS